MILSFKSSTFFAYWNQACNTIDSDRFFDRCGRNVSTLPCGNICNPPLWIFAFPPNARKLHFSLIAQFSAEEELLLRTEEHRRLTNYKKFPTGWRLSTSSYHHPCADRAVLLPKTTWHNLFLPTVSSSPSWLPQWRWRAPVPSPMPG